jgi:siroheme synthase
LLLDYATKGLTVVRLKGGDPFIFGRGEEECIYLISHGVECEIVPGISSFIAASARARSPVTSRGFSSSFAVITGIEDPAKGYKSIDVRKIAEAVDTIVILMGASVAEELLEKIASVRGFDEVGVIVMNATLPEEKIIYGSLRDLIESAKKGSVKNPAVIIIGPSVKLRERMLINVEEKM